MPKRRWYQFSLRTMLAVAGLTAVSFSVARTFGYVDAAVALGALAVLVGVLRYPRRVHPATDVIITLVAGILVWANLRPTEWRAEFDLDAPDQLDPVTKSMFYRGWPVCPFMLCRWRHMRLDPEGCFVQGALACDGVVFSIALMGTRAALERCFRRREKPVIESPNHPARP